MEGKREKAHNTEINSVPLRGNPDTVIIRCHAGIDKKKLFFYHVG